MSALDDIIDQHADSISEASLMSSGQSIVRAGEIADKLCKLEIQKLVIKTMLDADFDPDKFLAAIEAF